MKINNYKLKVFSKVYFLFMLFISFSTIPVFAHDADCGVRMGEQNALILGTIENIEGPECTISISEALPCPEGSDSYIMLPLSDIPSSIIVDMEHSKSYCISYNKRKEFKIGDYVILAVNKTQNNWILAYPPFEVSSLDSATLEFLPKHEKTTAAAAWEEFIHTKGKVHDFAFKGPDLLAKDPDSTDKNSDKKIFSENNDYDENITDNESNNSTNTTLLSGKFKDSSSVLYYALIPLVLLLTILYLTKKKRKNN